MNTNRKPKVLSINIKVRTARLKWFTIGIGFNGAETNCRIAHVLGILSTDDQLVILLPFISATS